MESSSPHHLFTMVTGSDEEFTDDEEVSPLNAGSQLQGRKSSDAETKAWDAFRKLPPPAVSLSEETVPWMVLAIKVLKVLAYLVTFVVVLCGGVLSKVLTLLMTSQLRTGEIISVCPTRYQFLSNGKQYVTTVPPIETVAWGWAIFFSFLIPEGQTFLRSARIFIFKSVKKPKFIDLVVVVFFETMHVIGLTLLLYAVLPDLDVVRGAMLTNCCCFIPGLFGLLSRNKNEVRSSLKISLDIASLLFQFLGFIAWPILEHQRNPNNWQIWLIPLSTFCISCGWWENYVDHESIFGPIQFLARIKKRLWSTRYTVYFFVSLWKCSVFFTFMIACLYVRLGDLSLVLDINSAFQNHPITITEVHQDISDDGDASLSNTEYYVDSNHKSPIYVFLLHSLMSYLCYIFGKFACKIGLQGFSFALPISLIVPISVAMLITACGLKYGDPCCFPGMPFYIFWECENGGIIEQFVKNDYAWMWFFWMLSQTWITLHIWTPKCDRLVSTEQLFVTPMYNSFLIDQSISLNRRKDDDVNPNEFFDYKNYEEETKFQDEYYESHTLKKSDSPKIRASDHVTRIYVCATMWHENYEEMMEFLKSIFRMDEDQSARRIMQQYFEVIDPDYYEYETHIYFDDAFEMSDENENENVVNSFVKLLVSIIEDAACHVHQTPVRIRPPKKYPTPYGGRLVWTLPGKTKIVCHVKDKDKIRHKKRWSQVMYMYYLLGFKLMEQPIPVERKEIIAENTYLLALDGDIDFTPVAVTRIIDLMKKNKNVGAACGRIHPVGSGFMVWYQKFEYAVGHWLQKATEHMIGCVLCSPGCFAMFRGKALMDDNVMAKYTTTATQAIHYVQYDQGEDRWLCTLLLQRGYRVEYSAASDSFTHAPEGFGEFYNQRRRWVPSTMANILDLLQDSKETIKVNDSISTLYIAYQMMLMVGTLLGPGTIFTMMSGAFTAAFGISQLNAFLINFIPLVIFMLICFTMDSKYQISFAYFLTAIYALVMVTVMIGMFITFSLEGYKTPTAIFFFITVAMFIVTGLLHPQELMCLPCGAVYYLVVPSMYLLLQIYSVFNLNNVSWGTREVATKKTKDEQEADKKAAEAAQKQQKVDGLLGLFYKVNGKKEKGSIEFSLAGLFKIMCCVQPKPDERQHVIQSLDDLRRKLESIEISLGLKPQDQRRSTIGSRKSILFKKESFAGQLPSQMHFDEEDEDVQSEDSGPKEERDDLVNPYWMEDKDLKRGEVDYLPSPEIQFWKDLIERYLRPLIKNAETQKKVADDLKELRNMAVFSFLMINSIFILIMYVLEINKEAIHINWPVGSKTNMTYDFNGPEVQISKEFLKLDPIGMMFVVFFGLLLLIQFIAMLFHRFGTFSHILSSTTLSFCSRMPQGMTDETDLGNNALAIVKDWQKPEAMADSEKGKEEAPVGRRATLFNIENQRQNKPAPITLDAVFKDRYNRHTSIVAGNGGLEDNTIKVGGRRLTIRRDTINALVDRRKSVVDRRRSIAIEKRRGTVHHNNSTSTYDEDDITL